MGAGRTEVARTVFGARSDRYWRRIVVRQQTSESKSAGGYFVRYSIRSEDRKRYGAKVGLDVETNIALGAMRKFLGFLGVVDGSKTNATATNACRRWRSKRTERAPESS